METCNKVYTLLQHGHCPCPVCNTIMYTFLQDKTEQDIRDVCGEILILLRPDLKSRKPAQLQKLLTAPVNLGAMARSARLVT